MPSFAPGFSATRLLCEARPRSEVAPPWLPRSVRRSRSPDSKQRGWSMRPALPSALTLSRVVVKPEFVVLDGVGRRDRTSHLSSLLIANVIEPSHSEIQSNHFIVRTVSQRNVTLAEVRADQ
jgi:hypothetical protein